MVCVRGRLRLAPFFAGFLLAGYFSFTPAKHTQGMPKLEQR
jgi:hypothetical protein